MAEQRLQQAFPRVPPAVVAYVLNSVAGGNVQLAQEALGEMTPADIAETERSLKQFGGSNATANLTAQQKEKLKQFKGIASCGDKAGLRCLSTNGWDIEQALNAFFSNPPDDEPDEAPAADPNKLSELHKKYHAVGVQEGGDEGSDVLQGAALVALSEDIDKSDPDLPLLIVAWKVDAKQPFQLSREEFVDGLAGLGIGGVADLQRAIALWRGELRNDAQFRPFYRFSYEWMRSSPQARALEADQACELWKMLLAGRVPWLDSWVEFVQTVYKKAITRDVWQQFLDFSKLKPDFSDYDADSAWPVLFDEFVEYAQKKQQK